LAAAAGWDWAAAVGSGLAVAAAGRGLVAAEGWD
jgi:hypothetical protein